MLSFLQMTYILSEAERLFVHLSSETEFEQRAQCNNSPTWSGFFVSQPPHICQNLLPDSGGESHEHMDF